MFEHRAVADLEDVADVGLLPPGRGLAKRHVADAPGRLDELLAADLGVGRPVVDVVVGQERGQGLLVDDLAAERDRPSARG